MQKRQSIPRPVHGPATNLRDNGIDHFGTSTGVTADATEYNMTDATASVAKVAIRFENGVNGHFFNPDNAQRHNRLGETEFARIRDTWCQELERAVGEMEAFMQQNPCPRQFENWVSERLSRLDQQAIRILNQTIGEPDLLDKLKSLSLDSSPRGYRCPPDGDNCPASY